MRHKALRWRFDSTPRQAKPSDWFDIAAAIEQMLPGAQTPLTPADSKLVEQYKSKPGQVYDTMPRGRDTCDRAFWLDAISVGMVAQANEQNADLEKLANDAAKRLPDRPELGRDFLRQWAEREVAQGLIAQPPAFVRRIAKTFSTQLGSPERAREVLKNWLNERRTRLGPRDADGRVRLANDYRLDLNDDDSAAKLLLEAVQIESNLPEAAKVLTALGYIRTETGWKRATESELAAAAATARGPTANRLPEKNMTAEQVRSIMGEPQSGDKIRLAYRHEGRLLVREQWTYRGPPDIYVTFVVSSSGDARVIAINTPSQK
jgi:hypothetical protein